MKELRKARREGKPKKKKINDKKVEENYLCNGSILKAFSVLMKNKEYSVTEFRKINLANSVLK